MWFDTRPTRPSATLKEMFGGIELQVVLLWINYAYTYREIANKMEISCFRVFEIMKGVRRKMAHEGCRRGRLGRCRGPNRRTLDDLKNGFEQSFHGSSKTECGSGQNEVFVPEGADRV